MTRTPIFYYHSVGGPPPQTLPREQFRLHLEAIRRHGFRTITLNQLLSGDVSKKCCVLTFDDGLLDNYEIVLPLLREYGMVATFFVVPGYDNITRWVNPKTECWSDVPKPGYTVPFQSMQAHHRKEILSHGMEIGCHTQTHRKLTQIPVNEWDEEILESKVQLETELGNPVPNFCYPNGRFNFSLLKFIERVGYQGACSTIPGYYHPRRRRYILPRFLVEDPVYFEQVLLGQAFHPGSLFRLLTKHFSRRVHRIINNTSRAIQRLRRNAHRTK